MATFEDAFKKYTEGGQGKTVAGMYDAQTAATVGGLRAAYDQNLSDRQAARSQIGQTYQAAGNDMQAQYERDRRNLNQQAAANGINTGAGSQQQLALQNVWNRDYGNLQGQRAQAYAEADRAIADLSVQYRAAVQQAQAQGDYRKMAALLDDYNTQYNRQLQQAQTLAAYGDFSGYNGMYSDEQVTNMRNSWIAQNPLLAYNTGAITADQYYKMTGQYAPGHEPAADASSSSGWSNNGTTSTEEAEDTNSGSNGAKVNIRDANAQAIINMAGQTGASAADIAKAVQEAAGRGLISASSVDQVRRQANQAAYAQRDAQATADRAASNGVWTPTLGARGGYTYDQAGYARYLNSRP